MFTKAQAKGTPKSAAKPPATKSSMPTKAPAAKSSSKPNTTIKADKSPAAKSPEVKPSGSKVAGSKSAGSKAAGSKAAAEKPSAAKGAAAKAGDGKTAGTKAATTTPAQTKPVPTKPAQTKPVPSKPAGGAGKGVKAEPAATKPSGKAPVKPAAKDDAKPVSATTPAAADAGKKPAPKGITVVTPKPAKKPKVMVREMPVEPLIKPGMKWKPLITSGPKAPPSTGVPGAATPTEFKLDPKAKLAKKELDHYRTILLNKRSELVGDINTMEDEALRQNSGSLSTLPQHMAEQGSDTFDQSLSLDLAQVDRHLLREIDMALKRIDEGTYGVCERTGKRISTERLAELPWARYSIEAAREMERRPAVDRSVSTNDDEPL